MNKIDWSHTQYGNFLGFLLQISTNISVSIYGIPPPPDLFPSNSILRCQSDFSGNRFIIVTISLLLLLLSKKKKRCIEKGRLK